MSQTQLAAAIGVTSGAITSLEEGFSGAPSFENGVKMAHALGVSCWLLAFGEDQPAPTTPLFPPRRGAFADPPAPAAELAETAAEAVGETQELLAELVLRLERLEKFSGIDTPGEPQKAARSRRRSG